MVLSGQHIIVGVSYSVFIGDNELILLNCINLLDFRRKSREAEVCSVDVRLLILVHR